MLKRNKSGVAHPIPNPFPTAEGLVKRREPSRSGQSGHPVRLAGSNIINKVPCFRPSRGKRTDRGSGPFSGLSRTTTIGKSRAGRSAGIGCRKLGARQAGRTTGTSDPWQVHTIFGQKLPFDYRPRSGHWQNAVIGCLWCRAPRNLSAWNFARRLGTERSPVPMVGSDLADQITWSRTRASSAISHGRFQRKALPLAPNATDRCIGWGELSKRPRSPMSSSGRRLNCCGEPVSGLSRTRAGKTWSLIPSDFARLQRLSKAIVSIRLG